MRARVLPVAEWDRLKATGQDHFWPWVSPESTTIVVVEEGDKIIATWTMMKVLHLEGLWAAPEYRGNAGMARRLLRCVGETAKGMGEWIALTGAQDDHVRDLLKRTGASKVEMDTFLFPVGEKCQSVYQSQH